MFHSVPGMSFVSKNILKCNLIISDFLKLNLISHLYLLIYWTYFSISFYVSYLLSVFFFFLLFLVIFPTSCWIDKDCYTPLIEVKKLVQSHTLGRMKIEPGTMSDLNPAFSHLPTK